MAEVFSCIGKHNLEEIDHDDGPQRNGRSAKAIHGRATSDKSTSQNLPSQVSSDRARRLSARAQKSEPASNLAHGPSVTGVRLRKGTGTHPDFSTEMPNVPHEPRYCHCQQVSYGVVCAVIDLLHDKDS